MQPIHLTLALAGLLPLGAILIAGQDGEPVIQDVEAVEEEPAEGIPEDTEIQTTDSGLQYSVLKKGEGTDMPKMGDMVEVHYTGWLTDGTKFDSSRDRGETTSFALGRVVEGWNEGLQLMSPGDRFKFTIPPELGYGSRPQGRMIPANSTLIFDVELISIPRKALTYVPWDDANPSIAELKDGSKFQSIKEGTGAPVTDAEFTLVEFAVHDSTGEFKNGSNYEGGLIGIPTKLDKMKYMEEALAKVKVGGHFLISMPSPQAPPTPAEGAEGDAAAEKKPDIIWQVKVLKNFELTKPEFVIPPEEELTTTESGLKYKVLEEGTGQHASAMGQFTAHYCGWTTDGVEFDSSYGKNPLSLGVGQVIPGWTEGLQLMKVGSKYLFVIPSEIGYGQTGSPPKIAPNQDLVFVVQLLGAR